MSKGTINKAIVLGRLGKDPEMRYAPSGTAIATFSVATNSRQKADGEWVDKTDWHNILAFGKLAEFAGEYLSKGKLIYIEGRIQTSSWEDQQGQKKYKTEIVVSELQMIGSKNDSSGSSVEEQDGEEAKVNAATPQPSAEEEDDLPF
jgi:single-strand DNA-binding protein